MLFQTHTSASVDPRLEYTPIEIDAWDEAEAAAQALPPHERARSPENLDLVLQGPEFFGGNGFLGAYLTETEAQSGSTPAEELANRRRTCQQLDGVRLRYQLNQPLKFRDSPTDVVRMLHHEGLAPIFTDHEIRASLSEDTVLLSIYERSVLIPARPGIIYMFVTAQTSRYVTVVYRGDQAQNQAEMKVTFSDGDSSRVIRFTPAAYRTAYLQNLLLEDPLS